MPIPEPERVFHTPRWVATFLTVVAVGLAIGSVFYYREEGLSLEFVLAAAFTLFIIVAIADSLTTSVRLYSDSLVIMSNFRRRMIPRSEIEHVTWEGSVGVSIRLKSDRWVNLPDVGNSQSVTNSIRAWLKRHSAAASRTAGNG